MRLVAITAGALACALGTHAEAGDAGAEALAELGFPALSRAWQGADYVKALELIESGKVTLPLLRNPQGAAILGRVTASENLAFLRERTLPLGPRAQSFSQMMVGSKGWLMLYLEPTLSGKKPRPHAELARIMAFMLDVSGVGVGFIEEVAPLAAADPPGSKRQEGLNQVRSGLTEVFRGTELTLSESGYGFTDEDYAFILRAMDVNLPTIRRIFPSDVAIELRKRLEADQSRFSGENRARLEHMVKELSPEGAGAPATADL